jgi:hypothetical protein
MVQVGVFGVVLALICNVDQIIKTCTVRVALKQRSKLLAVQLHQLADSLRQPPKKFVGLVAIEKIGCWRSNAHGLILRHGIRAAKDQKVSQIATEFAGGKERKTLSEEGATPA